AFTVPFVCGATNLGEALRRISEGACMIRSKGEAGTGNIVEAVRHLRSILGDIRRITQADSAELFGWAKDLQALGVDFVDESEVLTPADEAHHIDKWAFTVPFVCGATNLREALRRVSEGAALIRSKGEAGTGNIVEAVRHLRSIVGDMRKITQADSAELFEWAKRLQAPLPLVQEVAETGWLPVPLFCAGGIATPADAALALQLGAEAVFVGSGIFKSDDPAPRAKAIVEATTHFQDPAILAKVSRGLGTPMTGIGMDELDVRLAERGW
ncbi:MAG TPA: hypothetical protein VF065_17610, partial [Ilumatobacter sp.]